MIKIQSNDIEIDNTQAPHTYNVSNVRVMKVSEADIGTYMKVNGEWGWLRAIRSNNNFVLQLERTMNPVVMNGIGTYCICVTDTEVSPYAGIVDLNKMEIITADRLWYGVGVIDNGTRRFVSKILKTRVEFDDGVCYSFVGTAKKPRVLIEKMSTEALKERFEEEVEELLKARPEYRQIWKENWKK